MISPSPPVPDTRVQLLVDTVFFDHYPFNDSATNRAILARFELHTTKLVEREVQRKLGASLPGFVYVHNQNGKSDGVLSAADDSLLRLQDVLHKMGQETLLVTFDRALIRRSPSAIFGDDFWAMLSLPPPQRRRGGPAPLRRASPGLDGRIRIDRDP